MAYQEYTLAFFRETLRCFPSGRRVFKIVSQDTVLHATRFSPAAGAQVLVPEESFDGDPDNVQFKRDEEREERVAVNLPKGSLVVVDIWGLHMNRALLTDARKADAMTDAVFDIVCV